MANFVVNGEVVTGSMCRPSGDMQLPPELIDFAQKASADWMPASVFVLDDARANQACKIVECNCFNGSQFYSADVENLVRALSSDNVAILQLTRLRRLASRLLICTLARSQTLPWFARGSSWLTRRRFFSSRGHTCASVPARPGCSIFGALTGCEAAPAVADRGDRRASWTEGLPGLRAPPVKEDEISRTTPIERYRNVGTYAPLDEVRAAVTSRMVSPPETDIGLVPVGAQAMVWSGMDGQLKVHRINANGDFGIGHIVFAPRTRAGFVGDCLGT